MSVLPTILAIGIGATVGASGRYYLTQLMNTFAGTALPYGTLSANAIGSFLAGILLVVVLEKTALHEAYRLLFLVGLTGSLTTMSALSLESVQMMSAGNYAQAALNIGLNISVSLILVAAGVALARYFFSG